MLGAGRVHKHQNRLRYQLPHLASSPDVDLQQHVGPFGRIGNRGALQVVEELDPLQEPARVDGGLEGGQIDEPVRLGRLPRPAGAGGPRLRQPQLRVALHEPLDDRALAHTPRAGDDDDRSALKRGHPARLPRRAHLGRIDDRARDLVAVSRSPRAADSSACSPARAGGGCRRSRSAPSPCVPSPCPHRAATRARPAPSSCRRCHHRPGRAGPTMTRRQL